MGISLLSEWDVLAFSYRHGANLTSVEHIARLLGYGKAAVRSALDKLESLGLIRRSRASQGVRMHYFA
ncbi:MAG: helix-turn-helix domain-containing protein, partial [Bryobacteraceae bacterium]